MNAQDALDNAIAILGESGGQYTDTVRNAVSIWVAEALAEARQKASEEEPPR
jgi:hypothetical protein